MGILDWPGSNNAGDAEDATAADVGGVEVELIARGGGPAANLIVGKAEALVIAGEPKAGVLLNLGGVHVENGATLFTSGIGSRT